MRYATKFLALAALLAFVPSVMAADAPTADKPAEKHNVLHGKITKIDGMSITVSMGRGEKAKEVVVTTDDKTVFTIDHQPAKLEDLKVGELAAIGPTEGTAHHVDINTTHKDSGHALAHGVVTKVDGKAITITVGKGDKAKEMVVQTDDKTVFTVDHAAATLADVKEGELVAIAPAEGVAQHIDLNTTHKKPTDSSTPAPAK